MAPPDTQLAAGPNDLVSPVNDTLWVWSKTGIARESVDLNTFFSVPAGYSFSDPRVAYDATTSRWFLSGLAFDASWNSVTYLAVSEASDPAGQYNVYSVSARAAVLQDQPDLGFDSNVVVLSWGDYSAASQSFFGQETWVLQKSDLIAGSAVARASFPPDLARFGIVPVQSLAATDTEYLVYNDSCGTNTTGSCTTGSSALGLVAITGTPAAHNVSWSETYPTIAATTAPPKADQPGATASVDTDDDRFLTATADGGTIYVSGNVGCFPVGDSAARPCALLIEVSVGALPAVTLDAVLGYNGGDLYYPAAVPDPSGNVFIAATFSSASTYPEATGVSLAAGASSFSGIVFQAGLGTYAYSRCGSLSACRWGDYSGAAVDPLNPTNIWVAAEYAPTTGPNWGTAVGELTSSPHLAVSAPSSATVNSPITVTVTARDGSGNTNPSYTGTVLLTSTDSAATGLADYLFQVADAGVHTFQVTFRTIGSQSVTATDIVTSSNTGTSGTISVARPQGVLHAVAPFRLADTRSNSGQPLAGQHLGAGQVDTVPVVDQDGVPADATAAVLNVTVTNPTMASFLTVYPGASLPLASNLNFVAGQTVANLVTVPIASTGGVNLYNLAGSTDAVVDLEGYFAPGSGPVGLDNPLSPARIADTRTGSGQPNAGQTLSSGGVLRVQVDGVGGVPASNVSAVVLNVTATGPTGSSFLTAYPDGVGVTRPLASNLNFTAGQVVPNRVIVPVGPTGAIDVYNLNGQVDVVIDVGGWFTDTSVGGTGKRFTPINPTRVADTRPGSGQPLAGGTLGQGATVAVPMSPAGSSAAGAVAVAANVTVVNGTASSYLTAFPGGTGRPLASDLNWVPGQVAPNFVVTTLSSGGVLDLYNNAGSVDAIVDVFGFWS